MRRFVAEAELVELDGNGRFLISKRKLSFAGIESEVRFLAVDDHIEVWDRARCEQLLSGDDLLGADLERVMQGLPFDGPALEQNTIN